MYKLVANDYFKKKYKKLTKKNPKIIQLIYNFFTILEKDPFFPSIKTHKVDSKNFGIAYSSRITGDLRIIWNFSKENKIEIIEILDVGGHSGKNGVY